MLLPCANSVIKSQTHHFIFVFIWGVNEPVFFVLEMVGVCSHLVQTW